MGLLWAGLYVVDGESSQFDNINICQDNKTIDLYLFIIVLWLLMRRWKVVEKVVKLWCRVWENVGGNQFAD